MLAYTSLMSTKRQPRQNSSTLWYNLSDGNYSLWLNQFQKTCSNYQAELAVSDGDLEFIQDAQLNFDTALESQVTAKAIAEAATQTKDSTRLATTATIRAFVNEFQANTNIPEDIYGQLQIPKRGQRGPKGPAITPNNVIATGQANGDITIKFNRNGNPQSATMNVEHFNGSAWVSVANGPRTRFTLTGYPVGVEARFRVTATRGTSVSAPSSEVIVWGSAGTTELSIAA